MSQEDEVKRAEAKERFLRGLDLAAQENWDAALVEFKASIELRPTRAALTNAALSYRNLKRYGEAIESYTRLVQQFGDTIPADERKKVDAALAELRSFVGEIDVESDPPGAVVVVDGQERGTTPLPAPLMVNAGTHSVRVSREGFETFEIQVPVAGKQRKLLQPKLKRLAKSGTLVVKETSGKVLEVLVDGAPVGKTTWQGIVPVGTHNVALRGEGDIGSPPGSAVVKENDTTTLTLTATKLDAKVRVEPLPASARVDIDGVNVGAGVWEGKLTSGAHRVEVYATGHVPYSRDITIRSGQREVVRVALERDLSNPMWATGFRQHLFVELTGGVALAGSFGSGADAACDSTVPWPATPGTDIEGCSGSSAPFGFIVGARGGYMLKSGLSVEVFVGYLSMTESMTRNMVAEGEAIPTVGENPFLSTDAKDSTKVSGPLAALSASYQIFETTPLRFRLWAGVVRAQIVHELGGNFTGQAARASDDVYEEVTQRVDLLEPSSSAWIPLLGPEVRFGYQISKRFSADIGVAGFLFFGPGELRFGGNLGGGSTRRGTGLPTVPSQDGTTTVTAGTIQFDEEKSVGTFFGVLPTAGVRWDF